MVEPDSMSNLPEAGAEVHLLLVDDDANNRQLLKRVLERNYTVSAASSGEEAIERFETDATIDLILLDIMMPRVSGLDVLQHIRQHHERHDMPVILISALSDSKDVVLGLNLGANDYIPKPFDVGVINARVRTQLTVKRLLDERKQTIHDLQVAEQIRTQLFRIASHDLKNPLNNVLMVEKILRELHKDDAQTAKLLDTVNVTAKSMKAVIENFLDMVEIQTGHANIDRRCVKLHDVLMNVYTQYEVTAGNKDIQLALHESGGHVWADANRTVQIVSNLVSNAIKYSPQGTQVMLWTESVVPGMVRVCIYDQGPGVPQHERERLFQEFSRLSPRPTGGESSTGLGLWIVKHLANLQNGEAGADFPAEGGSIFWVDLPECDPREAF